jgi:hypothetical protein
MTNLLIHTTNAIAAPVVNGGAVFPQNGRNILISVLSATIIGIGAIFWRYFGHPALARRIKSSAQSRRRDAIIASFNQLDCSSGQDFIRNRRFIAIEIPNKTSRPIIVREVHLVQNNRPIWALWHDPKDDMPTGDRTNTVHTGVSIAPYSHGTWQYTGPEFTGKSCPSISKCQITFEYSSDELDVLQHTMQSPDEKDSLIHGMFEAWWTGVGNDIKRRKTQPRN